MITEIALLYVKPDRLATFETDFKTAGKYISSINGYRSHSLKRCLEETNKYILTVEWDTLEDHTVGFRKSDVYQKWKMLLHDYYEPFPVVEHYETIINN